MILVTHLRGKAIWIQKVAISLLLVFHVAASADQAEAVKAAKQFAVQPHECGLDHGYQCRDTQESNFFGREADDKMVSSVYLSAYQVALAEFMTIADLSEQEKQPQHYKIGFTENASQYVVHFQALLLPTIVEGQSTGIMRGTFGRTTRYWINKSSMEIEKRLFYK